MSARRQPRGAPRGYLPGGIAFYDSMTGDEQLRYLAALDDRPATLRAELVERMELSARDLRPADLNPDLCRKIRASILVAGPLTARIGEFKIPPPGGDVIGRRRVDLTEERVGIGVLQREIGADCKRAIRAVHAAEGQVEVEAEHGRQ